MLKTIFYYYMDNSAWMEITRLNGAYYPPVGSIIKVEGFIFEVESLSTTIKEENLTIFVYMHKFNMPP